MTDATNPTSLVNRRDGSVHNPLFKANACDATRDASVQPENRNLNCNGPIPLLGALGNHPDDSLSNASSDPPSVFGRDAARSTEETTHRKRLSGGSVCLAMLMIIVVAANIGFIYFNMFKTKICKIEMRN
jgi:hypothetical protein